MAKGLTGWKRAVKKFIDLNWVSAALKFLITSKYIVKNSLSKRAVVLRTPWVCELPQSAEQLAAYSLEVFNDYFRLSGFEPSDVEGKNILEIGPGKNLAVALLFLAKGAKKVVCIDRFASLADSSTQAKVYKVIVDGLSEIERARLSDVIQFTDNGFCIRKERLEYIQESAENLGALYKEPTFDLVISRAVLEHVWAISESLQAFHNVLKSGGLMWHDIDFRDHGIFSNYKMHPITFLGVPPQLWENMGSHLGAPNRKLLGFFRAFFQAHGYEFRDITRLVYESELESAIGLPSTQLGAPDKLVSEYQSRTHASVLPSNPQELLIAASFIVCRKS